MPYRYRAAIFAVLLTNLLAACVSTLGESTFTWSVNPTRAETTVGVPVEFEVRISAKSSINADVDLALGPLPEGFSVDLPSGMASTQTTATGTIYASPDVPVGTHHFEIRAREEGSASYQSQTIQLIVSAGGTEPDFSVDLDPTSSQMGVETGQTFVFYVHPLNGFTGTVGVTLSELPAGLVLASGPTPTSLSFTNSGGKGGTFVLRYYPAGTVSTQVDLIVTIAGGGITHSRTIKLTLPGSSTPTG